MDLGFLAPLAALLAAAAVLLGIAWFVLPYGERRACARCGSTVPRGAACAVCGQAPPAPPEAHPDAQPYGFHDPVGPERDAPVIRDGVAYNGGMTRATVAVASAAMGLGVGVRLVGLAGIIGLPAIPELLDGLLTIVGGLVAFVGFVFLDRA